MRRERGRRSDGIFPKQERVGPTISRKRNRRSVRMRERVSGGSAVAEHLKRDVSSENRQRQHKRWGPRNSLVN
nr:hypothetical protein Itr_chr07CG15720 [Ipomoea trifida]